MNAPAKIGHNNPPVDPFDAISADILDLFELAESALTGEPIANQEQADQIQQLADDCLKHGKPQRPHAKRKRNRMTKPRRPFRPSGRH